MIHMFLKYTQSTSLQRASKSFTQRAMNCGFTLIELLSVIAIVGVLVAILIPAVSTVRMSAYKAETTSDLRQVFVAVGLAASENKGYLPGPTHSGVSAGFTDKTQNSLSRLLGPYLTLTPPVDGSEYYTVEELLPATFPALAGEYNEETKGPTFLINQDVYTEESFEIPFGYKATANKPDGTTPKKMFTVPDPAVNVMLYGVDAASVKGSPGWISSVAQSPFFGNERPFLYWDGHIEVSTRLRPGEPIE